MCIMILYHANYVLSEPEKDLSPGPFPLGLNVTHKMIVKNYKYSKLKEIHKAEEKAINGRTGLSN